MTIGDIDKWISGETDVFFDTRATLPSVSADSNPGAKGSSAPLSVRKFGHPAIIAVVGAFTAVAWISSVSFMQHSAEPYSILDANSQPSDDGATSGRAPGSETLSTPITSPPRKVIEAPVVPLPKQPTTMLSDARLAAFLRQVGIWYDQRMKAATAPERKSSARQRASRRHWPRYSFRAQSDRGEATRLMVDELQQRQVAAIAPELGRPQ